MGTEDCRSSSAFRAEEFSARVLDEFSAALTAVNVAFESAGVFYDHMLLFYSPYEKIEFACRPSSHDSMRELQHEFF